MRWSSLPVSIAAHVAAFVVFLIVPLTADIELPPIGGRPGPVAFMPAAALPRPPAPPPPQAPRVDARSDTPVPLVAPDRIRDEVPFVPPGPPVDGAIGEGIAVQAGPPGAGLDDAALSPVIVPPPPPPALVRVGGKISEPRKIAHVAPVYPPVARAARVQGLVMLEAIIDERGIVDRIRVMKSVPLLDEAAVEAVRQWRYTPTRLNGVPVSVLMTISINFSLN